MTYSLVWLPQKGDELLQNFGVKGITGSIPCLRANNINEAVDCFQGKFDIVNIACVLFEELKRIGLKQYHTDNGIEDIILQFTVNLVGEYGNLAASDMLYYGIKVEPESKKIAHDCIVSMLLAREHRDVDIQYCANRIVRLTPSPVREAQLNKYRNEIWHYFYYLSVAYLEGISAIQGSYMTGITHPFLTGNLRNVAENKEKARNLFGISRTIMISNLRERQMEDQDSPIPCKKMKVLEL